MSTEAMRQQQLYENWLKRDTWLLRDEAVPLLLGLDPTSADPAHSGIAGLWETVRVAVEEGELAVYNRQAPAGSWSVAPAAVYRWANRKALSLPAPFSELMEFILQTVKQDEAAHTEADSGHSFNVDNENILGAALAVINAFPEDCLKFGGGIDIHRTIALMDQYAVDLFGQDDMSYTYERIYDLLKIWIGRIR